MPAVCKASLRACQSWRGFIRASVRTGNRGREILTARKPIPGSGWRVYGLGVVALAIVALTWGDFVSGQPVPKGFPDRAVLAYVAAVFMLVAGGAVAWRPSAAWGAAAVAAYYALIVVVLMDGHVLLAHYDVYVVYENIAEQLAIAAGGLIVYAASAEIDAKLAARLTRLGQTAFGVCALVFGGAHFFYMNLTAPLVPKWLPPSQIFWGYATGIAHIAGGLAILTHVRARLAAILLTAMYASFLLVLWGPLLLADPASPGHWTESATTLALTSVAWVVADSLARSRARGPMR